ncbi:YbaB/EbfC family nucleoid-associated protein [Dactylosporangium sp. NPDC005555]|uniref:YbaB/EbfC family nucleoid-associated protein n=1 Tax=Dactylosporangium sp. NPDC005555 TaxID=3154889 RepID=UPI0033BE14E4
MDRPNWGAIEGMLADLKRVTKELPDIQRKALEVTGTAWSDDRTVKAVVGPRGHLIELEIDPRVYRKPNSKELAATIVATVRKAIEESARQAQEIYDEALPLDMRAARVGGMDINKLIQSHDADIRRQGDDDG